MSVIEATSTELPVQGRSVDRLQLLDWLLPNCEPDRAAILYPKGKSGLSPGWITNQPDATRAVETYRSNTLKSESFASATKQGVPYKITTGQRLGLVPHRNGSVLIFCVDLDDHVGDGGNVHLLSAIERFFGAQPVTFTSKSGKGLHCFFRLAEPMAVTAFVKWARAWGFNRQGEPEVFPKTAKNTQAWLPNDSNDEGGDAYVSGTFEACIITNLMAAPSVKCSTTTLTFLRGFVRQPGRNDALNKAAFELGRRRVPRDEAWRLCRMGAHLCGLHGEEPDQTETTFESGYSSGMHQTAIGGAPAAEQCPEGRESVIKLRKLDGIGNGERFVDNYGAVTRYCYELSMWLVWTGKLWSMDAKAAVEAMAKRIARLILDEMKLALERSEAEGKTSRDIEAIEKAYKRHYRSAARASGVTDTLKMAQSEPGMKVAVGQLDTDPMLLNVANGTIDLRDGSLRPHRRGDAITKIAQAAFDSDAPCVRWMEFLDRIFDGDDELIAFIQRAVGYSLTGEVIEQCLFFLHGTGQNGKSVLIQTLLSVLGEYAQKAPTELIMRQERSSSGGATPDMARLRGVRLAVTAELDENQRMGEARVKDLTGADRVVARKLYCDPIEFDPTHKLWIYGNHKPTIRGTDDGIWRRIRLVPFTVKIPDEEKDHHLIDKLRRERNGILAWAVRGCLEWQRNGLGLSGAVASATAAYRSESDRLALFLDECCVVEPSARVGKGELYAAYEDWCRHSGERPMSKKKLGLQLIERGFSDERDMRRRSWIGLGLLEGGLLDASV